LTEEIASATESSLPSLLRSSRASLWAAGLLLAFACGEKFTGVETPVAGSSGSADAFGGAGDGGAEPNPSEGGRGGKQAGGGLGSAGKGGVPSVAGSSGGMLAMPEDGGAAGSGGESVDPPLVPTDGLEVWLRADQAVSAPVTGSVSTWRDSSGHQRNFTQSALNYQPILKGEALAGHPALVFDGVDDFLQLPAIDVDFAAGVSLFIVLQQESSETCEAYFEASTDGEENDLHFGEWMDSLHYEVLADDAYDTRYPIVLREPTIAVAVQAANGWVHMRRNGNGAGELQLPLPDRVERTQVFIGKSLYRDCTKFHGSVGEFLLYSRGLADSELLQVEQYLQQKWGCCGGSP
jgi:hypothetical protein